MLVSNINLFFYLRGRWLLQVVQEDHLGPYLNISKVIGSPTFSLWTECWRHEARRETFTSPRLVTNWSGSPTHLLLEEQEQVGWGTWLVTNQLSNLGFSKGRLELSTGKQSKVKFAKKNWKKISNCNRWINDATIDLWIVPRPQKWLCLSWELTS